MNQIDKCQWKDTNFKKLKKSYSSGQELNGKSLGIIGFGRIGQEVAKIGIGLGMKILAHDKFTNEANITLKFFNGEKKTFTIETLELNEVLKNSDFLATIPMSHEMNSLNVATAVSAIVFERLRQVLS